MTYKKTNKNIGTKRRYQIWKTGRYVIQIEMNVTSNSFITLKDNNDNSMRHPTKKLINSSKNEIKRISKHILINKHRISL